MEDWERKMKTLTNLLIENIVTRNTDNRAMEKMQY